MKNHFHRQKYFWLKFLVRKRNIAIEIISALFILLFAYTALSKFSEFESFKYVLKESPLIGSFNVAVAWALPTSELIIAAMLFIPKTKLVGLYSSLSIMTVFTLYLGYMIIFTPDRPCNCGGVLKQMTWNQHLIFNIFFTLLAATAIWLMRYNQPTAKPTEMPVVYT